MDKVLFLDVETTGINLLKDDPIQIAYMVYEGRQKIEEREIYLKTDFLPSKITEITGITKSLLDAKGISHEAAGKIWTTDVNRLDPDFVVGHNVLGFDLMLLNNWLLRTLIHERYPLPAMNGVHDTMMMAKRYFGISKWLSLGELARRLDVAVDESRLHNALYDIEVTAKCYFVMVDKLYRPETGVSDKQHLLF